MRAIFAVFKRELSLYFRSPIAYAVAFGMFFLLGLIFTDYISAAQQSQQLPADAGLAPIYMSVLLILFAPLLTMRLLAEENREGTLELLMTLPMNEGQFIIGKFLAAWAYYTLLLVISFAYALLMASVGTPDWGQALGTYFGAWLFGGMALAVTIIWSAVTEDQIVAAFLGAATMVVLFLSSIAAEWVAGQTSLAWASEFVRELGFQAHFFNTMASGVIRAQDVLYFIFMIIGALFITTRIVETRRWRA